MTKYLVVPDFPNYQVGTDGSVWSQARNSRGAIETDGWHELNGGKDRDGYRKVILCNNQGRKYCRVNVLILTTFKGGPPPNMKFPTAAHKNGDNTDNRLSNLKWKSQKDNILDKELHGTAQVGEKHPQSRLNNKKVKYIRKLRKAGKFWREIAKELGEKLVTVQAAGTGRNWKHI